MSKKNFLDRFKKPASSSKNNNNNNNPLAGWFGNNNNPKSFGGTGQSLGGSQPGQVIPIELSEVGPLGIHVEKRPSTATAMVQQVVTGSQAERAGLQRGDILCFAGSHGQEEILYDMFLELAQSSQRPLCFEVRRVPKTSTAAAAAPITKGQDGASADAYARRQAVIAAAEQREREHKKKTKPLPKKDATLPKLLSTAERQQLEIERQQQRLHDESQILSEATRAAREAAKMAEQETVAALGYNPYETKSLSAGQARTAVVAAATAPTTTRPDHNNHQHGSRPTRPSDGSPSIPSVASPPPLQSTEEQLPIEFQQAFETLVTANTNPAAVLNSLSVLRKLIVNATTKGQELPPLGGGGGEDNAAKFRKVRLANPKIAAAVTEMMGAVDLLLSVGFVLLHDDDTNESVLVYPLSETMLTTTPPSWLATALQQMERYK